MTDVLKYDGESTVNPHGILEQWSRGCESIVDQTIQKMHQQDSIQYPFASLPKNCRGRAAARRLKKQKPPQVIKKACDGQYNPAADVLTMHIFHKVKQMRRIQSLLLRYKKHPDAPLEPLHQEWKAVLRARGFGRSFATWVADWPELNPIPCRLPSIAYLEDLVQILRHHTDALVTQHNIQRSQHAKLVFQRDAKVGAKLAYRKVKEPPNPILSSVKVSKSHQATVIHQDSGLIELTCTGTDTWTIGAEIFIDDFPATLEGFDSPTLYCMLDVAENILPAQVTLTQPYLTTDPVEVAASLTTYWNQYWQRDQADTDWSEFLDIIEDTPPLPQVTVHLEDIDQWIQSFKSMHAGTAKGVDGWTVQELRDLPYRCIQALVHIFLVWRDKGLGWPKELMEARTLPLGKVEHPVMPFSTRPITVLAILYRAWTKHITSQVLSQWAHTLPPTVVGFVPGRSLATFLWEFQYLLELHHSNSDPSCVQGGLTLDLQKCFNTLGHEPIRRAMIHAGLPTDIANMWFHSISSLHRYWDINGGLHDAGCPSTGCPEGDTFSVLGCLSVCYIWQAQVARHRVFPFAYADNWGWRGGPEADHAAAIHATTHLTSAMRLSVDWGKSWAWGTTTNTRHRWKHIVAELLPNTPFQLLNTARELGAQMHYAKTHSRAVQRDRHKDALARLRRLRRVHVSLDVKSQIAHTAASIKALHATETYYVGQHWYKDLRSNIAQALVPDRPHANPHLTCMLASSRLIDPELFAILQGIKLARKVLHNKAPHEKEKFFSMVSKHDLNPKQVWGPAGALTINLQKVGWQMKRQGFIETDTMIEVHLMDSCYFHIAALLTQAWMRHLSQAVLYRKQWPQLPPIDRAATLRVLRKLDDAQRAIVIQDIAGTHYTTEQKEHAQVEETTCIYCHQPEDYHHRTLACPATEHIRDQHASVFAYFQEYEHHQARLPVVFQDPLQDFYDLYFQRRPPPEWNMDTMQSVLEHLQAGKEIHIWTDASCSQPHEPLLRRSAFAVVTNLSDFTSEAQEHALQYFVTTKTIPSTFATLGVGETQGKQTIDRGELQAVLAILDFFAEEIFPGRLVVHTDSAYVIQIAQKLLRCPQPSFAHGFKNYDHLRQLWVILRNGQFTLQKIKAHVAETNPHDLTFWHVGNEAADFAAKQFLQQQSRVNPLTPVLDPTTIALQLHAWFLYLCDLQTCRAQLKASAPEQPAVVTKQTWQERKQALLQWTPATPWVFLPPAEDHPGFLHTLWGTGITRAIVTWLSTIQWEHQPTADDRRLGTTWYELTFAFLVLTGKALPINFGGNGRNFKPVQCFPTDRDVTFGRFVLSFQRLIAQAQTLLQQPLMPPDTQQVFHLTLLGAKYASKGISTRCTYPDQHKVWTALQHFFLTRQLHEDQSKQIFPGYLSDTPTQHQTWTEHDTEDLRSGWDVRWQRQTAFLRRVKAHVAPP
eukprot:Skav208226  [mRNA]  locus=scaffold2601:406:4737:+ [translate_table: standard]